MEHQGGNGHGTLTDNGEWEQQYQFNYQRLDPIPPYLTVDISGRINYNGETRIPLEKGQTVYTPAGQKITVDSIELNGGSGKIILASPTMVNRGLLIYRIGGFRITKANFIVLNQLIPVLLSLTPRMKIRQKRLPGNSSGNYHLDVKPQPL